MAKSPAHKFGQIIGDVLEEAIEPLLHEFASDRNLYLDKKGPRPARKGNKVSWKDSEGNMHDLDFVLEENGTSAKIGTPVAFIEVAWRRYTKHSRNKAQEIQGAIIPLAARYSDASPFKGVILGGIFTMGAINQLKSLGFTVSFFHYDTMIEAFASAGINANFDERTSDSEFEQRVRKWEGLTDKQRTHLAKELIRLNSNEVRHFMMALGQSVSSEIILIRILPLHGIVYEWDSIERAITFIRNYDEKGGGQPIVKYEVEIIYNNGDNIRGNFTSKDTATQFLHTYQNP